MNTLDIPLKNLTVCIYDISSIYLHCNVWSVNVNIAGHCLRARTRGWRALTVRSVIEIVVLWRGFNEGRCDVCACDDAERQATWRDVGGATATGRGGGASSRVERPREQTARRPPTHRVPAAPCRAESRRYKINTCFAKSDFDLSTPELGKLDGSC